MDPLNIIINDENKAELAKAISSLGEFQRLCLRLVELEGLSVHEVAVINACTDSRVEFAVKDAKRTLRGFLVEADIGSPSLY